MKTCKKCWVSKSLDEFCKNPKMRDGYCNECKKCRAYALRVNRAKRLEHYREVDRLYARTSKRRAVKKKWDEQNREIIRAYAMKWHRNNRYKHRAHSLVFRAIRRGLLERKPCEKCGDPKSQAHHHDYSKPLEVKWLCRQHHKDEHRGVLEL